MFFQEIRRCKSYDDGRTQVAATGGWQDSAANRKACTEWLKGVYGAADTGISAQAYSNYPSLDLVDWQNEYYGANYPRLQAAKRTYDPSGTLSGRGVQGVEED